MRLADISARAAALKPSPTLAMTAKARQMNAEGMNIVSFAAGEPDFNTPEPVIQAAKDALDQGLTKYTPTAGLPALKQAVVNKLQRGENGIHVAPTQVLVSTGAKQSLANAVSALINPGDEVILLAPFWMTYESQVLVNGGVPIIVQGDAGNEFVPSLEAVREAVTDRTKAVMINSPCNPTGGMASLEFLNGLAEMAVEKGFWIISDEIYERLTYGKKHTSIATLSPEVAEQTITITGCSKTYSMTGWRIGFASGPEPVIKAMTNLQDQVTSSATSFSQAGAIEALNTPDTEIEQIRSTFERRRQLIIDLLSGVEGIEVNSPSGAFYVFPDVSSYLGEQFPTDMELAAFLLEEAHVATVPGSVFYGAGHLRLSYATSDEKIEEGVRRISDALSNL